jgi:hypothetical protein
MAAPTPPEYPLVFPLNRSRITQEPAPGRNPGDPTRVLDSDWSAGVGRGGGKAPSDLFWQTNPKQDQDDLSSG